MINIRLIVMVKYSTSNHNILIVVITRFPLSDR